MSGCRDRREIWIQPTRRRFCGSLPSAVDGEFQRRLRGLLVSLNHVADPTPPRTRSLVEHFSIVISSANVVNIPHEAARRVRQKPEPIFQAGVEAAPPSQFSSATIRTRGGICPANLSGAGFTLASSGRNGRRRC